MTIRFRAARAQQQPLQGLLNLPYLVHNIIGSMSSCQLCLIPNVLQKAVPYMLASRGSHIYWVRYAVHGLQGDIASAQQDFAHTQTAKQQALAAADSFRRQADDLKQHQLQLQTSTDAAIAIANSAQQELSLIGRSQQKRHFKV